MNTASILSVLFASSVIVTAGPATAQDTAQVARPVPASVAAAIGDLDLQQSSWSGPRIGFMVAPGERGISQRLHDHGLGDLVSQVGWHFERLVTPMRGGPQLVTEVTPLFAGAEYGTLIPSVTASIGVRSASGYEFGMGPSLTLGAGSGGSVGLVFAGGRAFDYGAVHLPLSLAVSTNQNGTMISVLAGYAVHQPAR